MRNHDFLAAAEMFSTPPKLGWSRTPMKYRRFDSLGLAVKYAVEDMRGSLDGVVIRTDDEELSGADIRRLYDSPGFPLARKVAAP